MLKNDVLTEVDWQAIDTDVRQYLSAEHRAYLVNEPEHTVLNYPVEAYPEKVKSIGFDKNPIVTGRLQGIKGQYLLLDENRVINIRKHNGYVYTFELAQD